MPAPNTPNTEPARLALAAKREAAKHKRMASEPHLSGEWLTRHRLRRRRRRTRSRCLFCSHRDSAHTLPGMKDPVVIRWSWGECQGLAEAVVFALRHPGHHVLRKWWWVWREHGRRGTWSPWTIGDHVQLIRMRRHMRHYPRRSVWPGEWRHR